MESFETEVDVYTPSNGLFLVGSVTVEVYNKLSPRSNKLWERTQDGELILEANETSAQFVKPWEYEVNETPVLEDVTLLYRRSNGDVFIKGVSDNVPAYSPFYVLGDGRVYEVHNPVLQRGFDKVVSNEFLGFEMDESDFLVKDLESSIAVPIEKERLIEKLEENEFFYAVKVQGWL